MEEAGVDGWVRQRQDSHPRDMNRLLFMSHLYRYKDVLDSCYPVTVCMMCSDIYLVHLVYSSKNIRAVNSIFFLYYVVASKEKIKLARRLLMKTQQRYF